MPHRKLPSPRRKPVHAEQLVLFAHEGGYISSCVCGKSSGVCARELDARTWLYNHLSKYRNT